MSKKIITAVVLSMLLMNVMGCGISAKEGISVNGLDISAEKLVKSSGISSDMSGYTPLELFKANDEFNNPMITNIFCADPTSVEYNGRLYVYGTNDNQQYLEKGESDNTYERIKSLVIISTDDMVNWQYEGIIDTASIAPWIIASWAPSVTSRIEDDGITHFYLYFSNSGAGVGVLTATDPAGPWSDPLGRALISAGMDGLTDCPNPFDPGVCIDGDGVGWLAFGGGRASYGTDYMPGSVRICRLGSDMISIDSDFVEIKAPYFFEASELNYINGTYVYTYNSSWDARSKWSPKNGVKAPAACSMCYMTSKTPLDTNSWEYKDYYLKNPGELGLSYSNNHTHLQKYNGKYFLMYHTLTLDKEIKTNHGFRSLCVSEAEVDENDVIISECRANLKGVEQIKHLDPYGICQAETAYLTDCGCEETNGVIYAKCSENNVIAVKGVDFSKGSRAFAAKVKGSGSIEIRLDNFKNKPSAVISFDCSDWTAVYDMIKVKNVHDIYFVMSGDFYFDEWQFIKK